MANWKGQVVNLCHSFVSIWSVGPVGIFLYFFCYKIEIVIWGIGKELSKSTVLVGTCGWPENTCSPLNHNALLTRYSTLYN